MPSVIKRGGGEESFNSGRIALAVTKAFLATGASGGTSRKEGGEVAKHLADMFAADESVHVEAIQDEVVSLLKKRGFEAVAEAYQKYRETRAEARGMAKRTRRQFSITFGSGERKSISMDGWFAEIRNLSDARDIDWAGLGEAESGAPFNASYGKWCDFWIAAFLKRAGGSRGAEKIATMLLADAWNHEISGLSGILHGSTAQDEELRTAGVAAARAGWGGGVFRSRTVCG